MTQGSRERAGWIFCQDMDVVKDESSKICSQSMWRDFVFMTGVYKVAQPLLSSLPLPPWSIDFLPRGIELHLTSFPIYLPI